MRQFRNGKNSLACTISVAGSRAQFTQINRITVWWHRKWKYERRDYHVLDVHQFNLLRVATHVRNRSERGLHGCSFHFHWKVLEASPVVSRSVIEFHKKSSIESGNSKGNLVLWLLWLLTGPESGKPMQTPDKTLKQNLKMMNTENETESTKEKKSKTKEKSTSKQ